MLSVHNSTSDHPVNLYAIDLFNKTYKNFQWMQRRQSAPFAEWISCWFYVLIKMSLSQCKSNFCVYHSVVLLLLTRPRQVRASQYYQSEMIFFVESWESSSRKFFLRAPGETIYSNFIGDQPIDGNQTYVLGWSYDKFLLSTIIGPPYHSICFLEFNFLILL